MTGGGVVSGDPHFLQKNSSSPEFTSPHAGQASCFIAGPEGGAAGTGVYSGEPHRSQKRDCRSDCVFPHFRQVRAAGGGAAGSLEPHRSQKTDAS